MEEFNSRTQIGTNDYLNDRTEAAGGQKNAGLFLESRELAWGTTKPKQTDKF